MSFKMYKLIAENGEILVSVHNDYWEIPTEDGNIELIPHSVYLCEFENGEFVEYCKETNLPTREEDKEYGVIKRKYI